MPHLRWDKNDFLECLGVIPEIAENEEWFGYTVARHGLILSVGVFQYESVIELRLQRETSTEELLRFFLFVEGPVEYKREKWGDYILFPASRLVCDRYYYMRDGGGESISQNAILNLEVAVDPDIQIRFE